MFPRQDRDTTGVYSRSGISGTGTTGRVVKIRLPGSISRATALNSPHETEVGVRFTGPDKLVHLVGLGEVVPRLGRCVADHLYRPVQAGEGFSNGNEAVFGSLRFMGSSISTSSAGREPPPQIYGQARRPRPRFLKLGT